jgi:hypothetical protein
MKRALTVALLALVAAMSEATEDQKCVLPIADGGPEPSLFNYQAVISRISGDTLALTVPAAKPAAVRTVSVRLTTTTQIFTVYGGFVDPTGLLRGQHVRIWLDNCGRGNKVAVPVAAVVQLASKRPGDTFP